MKLKSLLALTIGALAFATLAETSTPKGFTDNMDEALAQAKATGKYVYACFSGSDWCIWCKRLEGEVFSDKTFDFAGALAKDYVLVFIDSPRDKSVLSEHAKAHNKELAKKYNVRGYPTALILDSNGKQFESTGYRQGGAKAYVDHLMKIRKLGPDGVAKQKAAEEAVSKKYFAAIEKELDEILKPLNQGAPTAADLTKAADALEKSVAKIDALKFDDADKALAEEKQASLSKGVTRLTKRIRAAADRMAKKAEKAEKKTETK